MALLTTRTSPEDRARALDPLTSRADLVALAAHRAADVRAAVASRRDCPLASMLALVNEDDPRILQALACNPSAPLTVLETLAGHRRPVVREIAKARLRAAAQVA